MSSASKQLQPAPAAKATNAAPAATPFFAPSGGATLRRQATETPFFKPFVQPKLAVGRADDAHEREAEATADRVMRMPLNGGANARTQARPRLQAKAEEKEIRRKGEATAPTPPRSFETQLAASQSGGQPLSPVVRQQLEPRFGADFSAVRVHTDAPAVQMSQQIGAQAFTYQNHVYFNAGKYDTGSSGGQHLLAHELTHVVQQGAAVQRQASSPAVSTAAPGVQRLFGIDVAGRIDGWLAALPGWRLLTVLIGYNPVLQRNVPRTTANLIEGFLTLGGPIGLLLFNKLRDEGIIARAADWIDAQVASLGISLSYVQGLFSQAWDEMGISLGIDGNIAVAHRVFGPPFSRITAFVGRVVAQVVTFLKETIVRPLSNRARQMRGFPLLTVIIGKDPFTDEVVDRSPVNLVRGFMSLMDNGEERFRHMQESGALQRAFDWFNQETSSRNLTWERIKGTFTAVWDTLTPDAVLHPLETIGRIVGLFTGLAADILGFAGSALIKMLELIFEAVMGAGGARVLAILKRSRNTFLVIIRDPVRFVGNLVRAGVQGFRQFMGNALTHLQRGVVGWLLGALEGAGLQLPREFNLQGILSLVLQILGLTYQNIRAKLVRATSEQFVSRLEQVFDFLRILITQGPAAAWQKILEYLGNLRDMVLDGIIGWVRQTVVGQAIIRIASMLNPAGAVIQAIIATYNTVMFFMERINQIGAVVESYVNSIAAIAAGNIGAAATRVEETMGRMVPVIISFLARLLGLGGISNTIRNTIARVRQPVDRALDRVVTWVVAQGRRLVGSVAGGNTPGERVDNALAAAVPIVNRFAGRPVASAVLMPLLAAIKLRYQLSLLEVVPTTEGVWAVKAAASPPKQQNTQAQVQGAAGATATGVAVPVGSWVEIIATSALEQVTNSKAMAIRNPTTGVERLVNFTTATANDGVNTLKYSKEGTVWRRSAASFKHPSKYVVPVGGAKFELKPAYQGSSNIRPWFYPSMSTLYASRRDPLLNGKFLASGFTVITPGPPVPEVSGTITGKLADPLKPAERFISEAAHSEERWHPKIIINGQTYASVPKRGSVDHFPDSMVSHWNNDGRHQTQNERKSWFDSAAVRLISVELNSSLGNKEPAYKPEVGQKFKGKDE
ncbi:eCIS core domain-containing protein [Hymenobacter cavernae]|uniref:eCIS core domain-containing protein n=1 Tax=Hymenobacter cavernae TaxID=2044852 RepID=A0ABQ1UQU7_9BACT|nr:DUF4157 domain-containing protein [Hymenobacter cavernae]GGF24369.1 hypothetical protein GCM10011383_40010 [Hymenobacter cavernae]